MNLFGLIGSLFLTFCGVPELIKTLHTKKCNLSWGYLIMYVIGEIFCLVYAIQIMQIPLLINFSFNLVLSIFLFTWKFLQKN